jgi:phenylacetate-CoA ligase
LIEPIEILRKIRHTIIPLPLKYGRVFRQTFKFLMQHQHVSRRELEDYQWQRLKALLKYAYEHVPFYRNRLKSIGAHPEDIKTPEDFRCIPQLGKEEVAANTETLKSDEFERFKPILTMTSGTTRDRLIIYRSQLAETWRKAVVWRHFFNLGYRFREARVRITMPLKFVRSCQEMPVDYNENMLMIDPHSINHEFSEKIHRRVREFAPGIIVAQPGSLTALVEHFKTHKLEPWPVKIVYLLGEKVFPEYRMAIESYFGIPIKEYYGNKENTVAVTQLNDGRNYIQSDYCYLEFVNDENRWIGDQPANIVSTSLVNYAFPLIRYQTEDVGVYKGFPEGAVRNFPTMSIVGGRGKDLLLTPQGLICCYEMFSVKKLGLNKIRRAQLEQVALDEIIVRVMPLPGFTDPDDLQAVERAYRKHFKGCFKVRVEVVEDIPCTDNCKNRLVISNYAIDHLRKQLSR